MVSAFTRSDQVNGKSRPKLRLRLRHLRKPMVIGSKRIHYSL